MAEYSRNVPAAIKKKVLNQASNQCANPGCPYRITEIHHIKEWAIYKTHDEKDMIALCPNCHASVHRGELRIDDETLYEWKKISNNNVEVGNIFIKPAIESKLVLGSFSVMASGVTKVFKLSKNNELEMNIDEDYIFLVGLKISNAKGKVIFKVKNNITFKQDNKLKLLSRQGKILLTSPIKNEYIPNWLEWQIRKFAPEAIIDNKITLLDIEVIKPGVLKIKGLWQIKDSAYLLTDKNNYYLNKGCQPSGMSGHGEDTVIHYEGDKSCPILAFE